MYKVFQIKISNEVTDFVNSNDNGHSGGEAKYPEYAAHMAVMHKGAEGFKGEMFNHYSQVCEVAHFEDSNLEEVFKILNGYYFDDDTGLDQWFDALVSGFKMKTFTRKDGEVVTYRDMHSLSVGDIVFDSVDDSYHIVDRWGFQDITSDVIAGVQEVA